MRALTFMLLCLLLAAPSANALTAEDSGNPLATMASEALWDEVSRALITETGVAISPLVGLSYLLLKGDPMVEKYSPWIWIVLALLIAVVIKDVGGTFVPGILKKPLDALEFFQNQGLGVLCAVLLVPDLHQKLYAVVTHHAPLSPWTMTSGHPPFFLAAAGTEGILHVLTLPLSLAIFAAVWLLSNTLNALILLSPFSLVDACLKGVKLAGLAALAALSAIHPYLGAGLSLVIVAAAFYLSGRAFRLYVFGWIFATDVILRRHRRFQPGENRLAAFLFLDRETTQVPARTYGSLMPIEGTKAFRYTYRPWLVLPGRTIDLPAEEGLRIARGLLHVTIEKTGRDGNPVPLFHLPPRYRGHAPTIGRQLGLEVVDVGLRHGFKMTLQWIKQTLRTGESPAVSA